MNPELYGRVDTSAYKIGLATARNVVVRATGGAINRPGLEFIGFQIDMANPSRLRRFRFNATDTYMLEFGHLKMRVIRDDAHVTEAAKTILGVSLTNPMVVNITGHGWSVGDDIEFTVVGMTRLNGRRLRVGGVNDANHVAMIDIITGATVDATSFSAFTSGTAARVYTLATPYINADLKTLKFVQSASVMTITHPNYAEGKLTRTGDAAWTLVNPTFAPTIAAPTGVAVTPVTTGTTTASYVVTALSSATGEESLPSTAGTTALGNATADNTVTWSAVTGTLLYSVYKAVNGVYGFVGTTPNLTFEEKNLAPDLTTTPPGAGNPFVGSGGNWPACSTYYQQRHVRAGSTNDPDTLNYSKTANFYNFSTSTPSQADDAIKARLTSREVNVVKHMVPLKDLIVFTAGGEWRINSAGQGFSSATMQELSQSTWGSSDLEPILIGQTILFVPENRISVRSFAYTYVADAYQGNDLTLLSAHLFKTWPLVDWGYSRSPDPIIYGVRADGAATAFTFQEEQQVSSWTRWDTLGFFEAVDVVRPNSSGPDEMPYFGIRRTVNGHTVRYIERMHSRRYTDVRDCFFVDSGLSFDNPVAITSVLPFNAVEIGSPGHPYHVGDVVDISEITWTPDFDENDTETQPDVLNNRRFVVYQTSTDFFSLATEEGVPVDGTNFPAYVGGGAARITTQTVAGLDHLEGRTVQCLADGNVIENLFVLHGSVTLPFLASRIHIGLKYISDIETLDLEAPQGTIQGKVKRASTVTVRYNQSRGMFIGQNTDELLEVKQREDENMGDPTALFSGDEIKVLGSAYNTHGRILLRQRYPLPMDILFIEPNMTIEP